MANFFQVAVDESNDNDVIDYLQNVGGYSMTDTRLMLGSGISNAEIIKMTAIEIGQELGIIYSELDAIGVTPTEFLEGDDPFSFDNDAETVDPYWEEWDSSFADFDYPVSTQNLFADIEEKETKSFLLDELNKTYTCTCKKPPTHINSVHENACNLLSCQEYMNMKADWNPSLKKLVLGTSTSKIASKSVSAYVPKCRHYQTPVVLPGDITVYASSHHYDREIHKTTVPDLGIYMDGCWSSDSVAFAVGWQDYGLPTVPMSALFHMAREGIRIAQAGGIVELGCIGGHGRTGSMLAVMTLLASHDMGMPITGEMAVWLVRNTYCNNAIEGAKQAHYIACVAAELKGETWPEPPPPPVVVKSEKNIFTKTASKSWATLNCDKCARTLTMSGDSYVNTICNKFCGFGQPACNGTLKK